VSVAEQTVQHIGLRSYLERAQQVIRAEMPDECWIVAELTEFKRRQNGHVYMDLLEAENGREVAKARATMFGNVAGKVIQEWEQVTGGPPQPGMSVLLRVRAELSPQYGFSLSVSAIDPAYTLGDMQAKVQRIITALKTRDLFDLQRRLPAPAGYWRVAVVAPHEAAGLADFKRDAEMLAEAGACVFEYFAGTFQGRDAVESLCAALMELHGRHKASHFDVVCIIRGGGSKADLAWLNDGKLASWICRLPIPVFTGIGHQVDECVLDLVAQRRFDTPSKVIGFIRGSLAAEAVTLRSNLERGEALMMRQVSSQAPALERAWGAFSKGVGGLLHKQHSKLLQTGGRFESGRDRLIAQQQMALKDAAASFCRLVVGQSAAQRQRAILASSRAASLGQALLVREQSRLTLASTIYEKTNPLALLNRGFALVRSQTGNLVANADQALRSGVLELTFSDGKVNVWVE